MENNELRLSDQVIGQIRELLQLSILSQSNFVDHMRALRLERSSQTEGSLILSKSYVEGWNDMAEKLHSQALEKAGELASTLATDGDEEEEIVESDQEVVISRNPETGKLVVTRGPTAVGAQG
jgi:hypothetical protein